MKDNHCQYFITTALDEIAWLLNLRGNDIPFNPVFISYVVVSLDKVHLFANKKVNLENLEVHPYKNVTEFLSKIEDTIWVDTNVCNMNIYQSIKKPFSKDSPIILQKAIKNEKELEGMRKCQERDAVALVKYLYWLETELKQGNVVDEVSGADKLEAFRKENEKFVSLSFDSISAMGANGSIIHYKPEKDTCSKINMRELYLIDSGAQYLDGTTDTTRTVHFGTPSQYEKECFTSVLKGHIALDTAIFPAGTSGGRLDTLARQFLWRNGQNYLHGTGHGVGHFLNVHEGPHSISMRDSSNTIIYPGMVTSNEPGYYEDKKFGIRIESLIVCKEVKNIKYPSKTKYLEFEHITYVPFQTSLIDINLMSRNEIKWVNDYNQLCFNILKKQIKDNELLHWLENYCKEI